jgi:hypothetical protein
MSKKIYVLTVSDDDIHDVYVSTDKNKLIEIIENDIKDHNHFDSEPYITEEELEEQIEVMKEVIEEYGWWKSTELVEYYLNETEMI